MKRTILAFAVVALSLSGMAHADRNTQVNLRVTELSIPLMNQAHRTGSSDSEIADQMIAFRPDAAALIGELYDMGALEKEQNVWWEDVAKNLDSDVQKILKEEVGAEDFNQEERQQIMGAFKHAVMDGYQGR